jgi:dTDP-4-amino-4,6-dideoxygalactose transaminase
MRPWLDECQAAEVAAAIASGWVAQGPRAGEVEGASAESRRDENVVASPSLIAKANAVRYVGAQPVFADVDESRQKIVPVTVDPRLTGRTRAVALMDASRQPVIERLLRMLPDPAAATKDLKSAAMGAGSR